MGKMSEIELPEIPESDVMKNAKKLADQMIKLSEETDCPELVVEWAKEHYWGYQVTKVLPTFKFLREFCIKNNHLTYETGYSGGDYDWTIWAESAERQDVLIINNHVTCHSRPIFIYTFSNFGEEAEKELKERPDKDFERMLRNFHCIRVKTLDKEKKAYDTPMFKDHRDVKYPSVETIRKNDFEWGYRDGRDNGHCFILNRGQVDKAHWHENEIKLAIDELNYARCDIESREKMD